MPTLVRHLQGRGAIVRVLVKHQDGHVLESARVIARKILMADRPREDLHRIMCVCVCVCVCVGVFVIVVCMCVRLCVHVRVHVCECLRGGPSFILITLELYP